VKPHRAKKSLGQHFLKNKKVVELMLDAGKIQKTDLVLEIGPGMGILTEELLARAKIVVAVEKDEELSKYLREKFREAYNDGRLVIVTEDILNFDLISLQSYQRLYKIIANIPYYITGAILEKCLSATFQPERMVIMLQDAVGERIVTKDGKESILSLSVKAFGTPRVITRVPRGSFDPSPNVDSLVLLISDISRNQLENVNEGMFFTLIHQLFRRKRKMVGKFIKETYGPRGIDALKESGIDPTRRPETIKLNEWLKLLQVLS